MTDPSPTMDIRAARYRAAWAQLVASGPPTLWKTELQGLPLAIRQQGLAPQLARMIGRGGSDLRIADAIAAWVISKHPGAPLVPVPRGAANASEARALLVSLMQAEDAFAVAVATDEAIEFAAALKRLAV